MHKFCVDEGLHECFRVDHPYMSWRQRRKCHCYRSQARAALPQSEGACVGHFFSQPLVFAYIYTKLLAIPVTHSLRPRITFKQNNLLFRRREAIILILAPQAILETKRRFILGSVGPDHYICVDAEKRRGYVYHRRRAEDMLPPVMVVVPLFIYSTQVSKR